MFHGRLSNLFGYYVSQVWTLRDYLGQGLAVVESLCALQEAVRRTRVPHYFFTIRTGITDMSHSGVILKIAQEFFWNCSGLSQKNSSPSWVIHGLLRSFQEPFMNHWWVNMDLFRSHSLKIQESFWNQWNQSGGQESFMSHPQAVKEYSGVIDESCKRQWVDVQVWLRVIY